MMPDLTLALPAYNEEAVLASVVADGVSALDDLGLNWEILIIDNASTDTTPRIATRLAANSDRIRSIRHEENRLYSGSCTTAIREANGRYIAIVDSDGQADIRDMPLFLEKLQAGANLVVGWRRDRKDGIARKAMSVVFNLLGKIYLKYPHHDLNCGFRVFDRTFADVATINHRINLANPELWVRAKIAGLTVAEVPIRHYSRTQGDSSHDFKRLGRVFRGTNTYMRNLRKELRASGAR